MAARKIKRRRGVLLTALGYQKLAAARVASEQAANFGVRYTNEELRGLNAEDSDRLFYTKRLSVSRAGRTRLLAMYSGNPIALNIVATSIFDLYDGAIDGSP
jgi:hypothetical protein